MGIDQDDFENLSDEEKKAYIQAHLLGSGVRDERQEFFTQGWPQTPGQFLAGLLGLPIERRSRIIQHPLLITTFIALLVGVQILLTYIDGLKWAVLTWGFIPSEFYRSFFMTTITSFFIHGSWMHLLGNCYYFYIFGDDVEDDMDLGAFLRLLFFGHIAGLILHMLLSGFSSTPLVGASAGISALMGYYMIRFPKRQITFMLFFFYFWIHIPAFAAFLWKFGWEFVIASSGMGRSTGIAHWAHLGGFLWGVIAAKRRQ